MVSSNMATCMTAANYAFCLVLFFNSPFFSLTDRIRTQNLSQTAKGKTYDHILTNINQSRQAELAALSRTGTFTKLNNLDTYKCQNESI